MGDSIGAGDLGGDSIGAGDLSGDNTVTAGTLSPPDTVTADTLASAADVNDLQDDNLNLVIDPTTEGRGNTIFGDFELISSEHKTTEEIVFDHMSNTFRQNDPDPRFVNPWEMRIGGSHFFVPPLNVKVSQSFKAGALTGGAIRQPSSPKFNTGHSETMIEVTLYFPTHETIWGFSEHGSKTINFDKDDPDVIDTFLSSLRGLIAQFKYAPFLPIRNTYLNKTFGITGVALQDMTISTIEGFPFAMAVTLTMLKFNHKVYLPMIQDFDQAIHWGRFRQYMGRAAARLEQLSNRQFLEYSRDQFFDQSQARETAPEGTIVSANDYKTDTEGLSASVTFDKARDVAGVNSRTGGKAFELYIPFSDPAAIDLPDDKKNFNEEVNSPTHRKEWWQSMMGYLGIDVSTEVDAQYEQVAQNESFGPDQVKPGSMREAANLKNFLDATNIAVTQMNTARQNEWIDLTLSKPPYSTASEQTRAAKRTEMRSYWWRYIYNEMMKAPHFARFLANQQRKAGSVIIQEWEVPMVQVGLDQSKVFVQGVSVSMSNLLARLQIQMEDEPTHQHIGGGDTTFNISMVIFGESELLKLRRMFDSINGLARLEHAHGVLGFMGVKNVITALSGMRYAIPQSFDVQTIPNYPHVYQVQLTFTDFDVFQSKREQLSIDQQADMIRVFSKRNPFLRIKQYWGVFSAYPDFPLAVRDEDGKVIGSLDPDFYFRHWQNVDDDVVDLGAGRVDPPPSESGPDATSVEQPDVGGGDWASGSSFFEQDEVHVFMGKDKAGKKQWFSQGKTGVTFRNDNEAILQNAEWNEPHSANMITRAYTRKESGASADLTPASSISNPYILNSSNPQVQYAAMQKDWQYRDKSGRMVRAFPTYMLWFIDEGGMFAGVKMFDQFYGLQSVLDFSFLASEDILADTLQLRISNLYSRLSTKFRDEVDDLYAGARIINTANNRTRRLATGFSDQNLVKLDTFELRPGVRIHLRAGFSGNPNSLETLFNGVVTEVEQGEIMTITCQSDSVELGAVVNAGNKEGHSGKIDGSLVGLYMSEPRDLMLSLLTQGSSAAKEALAHASRGVIFSENRWAIRHFGSLMYSPLTESEERRQEARKDKIQSSLAKSLSEQPTRGGIVSFISKDTDDIISQLWTNLNSKRDYEVFKRNIYPGNGTGIAQFMGGDIPEVGLAIAMDPASVTTNQMMDTSVNPNIAGSDRAVIHPAAVQEYLVKHPETGEPSAPGSMIDQKLSGSAPMDFYFEHGPGVGPNANRGEGVLTDLVMRVGLSVLALPLGPEAVYGANRWVSSVTDNQKHAFGQFLGLTHMEDDDLDGADEVSFRAQTYMKTVWDLFQLCAALLPNYIVAVRPFEDRSTVFYGKPHWMYTSGLIPLTTGVDSEAEGPQLEGPDTEWAEIFQKLEQQTRKNGDEEFYDRISKAPAKSSDPSSTTAGVYSEDLGEITALPMTRASTGASISRRSGTVGCEMHLPTNRDLDTDKKQHLQIPELPKHMKHPFYMDMATYSGSGDKIMAEGGVGGVSNFTHDTSKPSTLVGDWSLTGAAGRYGGFGFLDPKDEQYYIAMRWPYATKQKYADADVKPPKGSQSDYRGMRVMVYCPNKNKAVVCTPGDWGPNKSTGHAAGLSPDAFISIGSPTGNDPCFFGVMPDTFPLGPVDLSTYKKSDGSVDTAALLNERGEKINQAAAGNFNPEWLPDGTADVDAYSRSMGWANVNVPPDYSDPGSGIVDPVGAQASEVYAEERSSGDAKNIWKEFRQSFFQEQLTKQVFFDAYPKLASKTVTKEVPLNNGTEAGMAMAENQAKTIVTYDFLNRDAELAYDILSTQFKKFLWNNPFHRGWVVRTADKQLREFLEGTRETAANVWEGGEIAGIDYGFGWMDTGAGDRDWNFHVLRQLWRTFILEGDDGDPATEADHAASIEWMKTHMTPGKDTDFRLGRIFEDPARAIYSVVDGALDKARAILSTVTNGVLAFMRLSMLQMSQGLSMASDMQRRTNILSRSYNDSIYYDATQFKGLELLADNPFTREYGEPVIEIRQPFQRIHHINSFQHIISNQMTDIGQVPTVVTAVSNGNHPVTVHFDKGLPPEKQVEKTIETGLYWDQPKGWLGLKKIIHPMQTARMQAKQVSGIDDKIMAKRVALYHLKESLKDIYGGDITILGDPSIRPHDLVYISDVYERIYGFFEVEQVVHHFTPEFGFITMITPNAVVSVNDPARWSILSFMRTRHDMKRLRDHVRRLLDVDARNQGLQPKLDYTFDEIAGRMENQLLDSTQYTGGIAHIVSGLTSMVTIGGLIGGTVGGAAGLIGGAPGAALGFGLGFGFVTDKIWGAWEWVRDNLLDQHGCTVQYLSKNGKPMDGGLGYAQGVAVGQQHGLTMMVNGLRLGFLSTNDKHFDGQGKLQLNSKISTSELLQTIGYTPLQLNELSKHVDIWTNATSLQVRELASRNYDGHPFIRNEVYWARVTHVVDSDTVDVAWLGKFDGKELQAGATPPYGDINRIRFAIAQSVEDPTHGDQVKAALDPNHPGVRATTYVRDRLLDKTVAIRVYPVDAIDSVGGRLIAFIFYNALEGMDDSQRQKFLLEAAGGYPDVSWEAYTVEGKPFTINKEIIDQGYATAEKNSMEKSLINQGVRGNEIEFY